MTNNTERPLDGCNYEMLQIYTKENTPNVKMTFNMVATKPKRRRLKIIAKCNIHNNKINDLGYLKEIFKYSTKKFSINN